MPWRLFVVDGADRGQTYPLPPAGTVRIGNYGGKTEICLHDLYVAKDHCHVEVADGRIVVTAQASASGTLVNDAKITQQELKPGDVIRAGNSRLRLEEIEETADPDGAPSSADTPPNGTATVPAGDLPGALPHLPTDRLRELTNFTLGHYKIGPALAPGPVGTTFRAKDLNTDQEVALKVLPTDFPAADAEVQRFVRVMKQFLAAHHPGMAGLKGVGKTGPYVWVASELVTGESLAVIVRDPRSQKKGKWRLALRVTRHVARTLDFLQRRHLVHGSVTPANVLLPPEEGPPKLKDAGMWDALAGSALLRHAVGKRTLAELAYLSPEHVDPTLPVDDLSDQYCLGAVAYGLLTGRPPCEGSTPEETVQMIQEATPLRAKEACPGLPDAFQAVVLRMLAKHPEDRYPGPGPLLADLDAVAAKCGEEG
jgi:eukaryotic-like serine/threonine-protein kinase